MFNLKKNVFASILITSFILFLAGSPFVQAAERELELEYPEIGGWRPETVEQTILPQYIKYIFTFSIAIAGLVAFGSLIYGGFRYITSAGAPTAQTEAKDQIFAGIIGLVILLSSYLILNTINPQLTLFKSPKLSATTLSDMPGVYLSKNEIFPEKGENVYRLPAFIVPDFETIGLQIGEIIKSLKIVNQPTIEHEGELLLSGKPDFYYGVILYEKKNLEGDCAYFRSVVSPEAPYIKNELPINPASAITFKEVEPEEAEGEVKLCSIPEVIGTDQEKTYCKSLEKTKIGQEGIPSGELEELKTNVWQIGIDGKYLLVLYDAENKRCEAFFSSQSDLKGSPMNKCKPWWYLHFFGTYKSCATHYALFPTY